MITNNDYEKSVLIVELIKELKGRIADKENVTNAVFTPVVNGYEVSFSYSGKSIRVTAEVKGFFAKNLIIRKYTNGKMTTVYKAYGKEEISRCADLILSE